MFHLIKTKIANLEPEQLKELKNLEEKLNVTLIAYEQFVAEKESYEGNNSNAINPS